MTLRTACVRVRLSLFSLANDQVGVVSCFLSICSCYCMLSLLTLLLSWQLQCSWQASMMQRFWLMSLGGSLW